MNQSLINEIRSTTIQIDIQKKYVAEQIELRPDDEPAQRPWRHQLTSLLLARAQCMNAIAVLVAANKR